MSKAHAIEDIGNMGDEACARLRARWDRALTDYRGHPDGLEFPDLESYGHLLEGATWERGPVEIKDESGNVIFVEPRAEFPTSWGDQARTIVAQKYFHGDHEQGFRETSLKQLLTRVTYTIALEALRLETFRTSQDAANFLCHLMLMQLNQEFAFNSPVYFNAGIDAYGVEADPEGYVWIPGDDPGAVQCSDPIARPQISACFIQSVEDNMSSIMDLAKSEAMLFKRGSGTGTDLSTLRSSREKLSGGGRPSGPLSFLKVYDAVAGIVKSGGRSRRAAKMNTLSIYHPDIMEFIECKSVEERKARALIAAGYEANFNGEAYSTVAFQNENLSVRVTDRFMDSAANPGQGKDFFDTVAVTTGEKVETLSALGVLNRIAVEAHFCGDPGLQYADTIDRWHTVPNHSNIHSSNPCSEYIHVNDSACNLASINLVKFRKPDGTLDVDKFCRCVDVAITAQETLVGLGSYPTAKIAENSHKLRPLGLGHANGGAYCMMNGCPYDSDSSRNFLAAVTSLMTARAYRQSSLLAKRFGAFEHFAANRDPMMEVIEMHRAAHWDRLSDGVHRYKEGISFDLGNAGWADWFDAVNHGGAYGFRNSQATCIAPTGTIGFMMGCDTLGIEPEIALVRYKMLAGRGMLKIVNGAVGDTLRNLGYEEGRIRKIIQHIMEYSTIQDVIMLGSDPPEDVTIESGLVPEHLAVFDCAFGPEQEGVDLMGGHFRVMDECRSIAPMGHVAMMAACTPFVSGAISKTVNVPESATVEDIRNIYIEAWRLGCKSIAVYRDNSKGHQPVTTKAPEAEGKKLAMMEIPLKIRDEADKLRGDMDAMIADAKRAEANGIPMAIDPEIPEPNPRAAMEIFREDTSVVQVARRQPERLKLPDTRRSLTHKFAVAGHEGYITVGFYEQSTTIGEVFITMSKSGSTVGGLVDVVGTMISIGLQYGVPLGKIVEKLANQQFEPRGITINREIPFARSIMDYVGKWIGCQFIDGYRETIRPMRGDDRTPAAAFGPGAMDAGEVPVAIPDRSKDVTLAWKSGSDPEKVAEARRAFAADVYGSACDNCGSVMVRQGMCEVCFQCGATNGGCGG